MAKSSLLGTQPRVLADFGSICRFIVVGYDHDVLSCAYSTSERFYVHVNTS